MWDLAATVAKGNPAKQSPRIKIQVDHNGTRVAAQYNLLHSELRLHRALPLFQAQLTGKVASECLGKWNASPTFFQHISEVEAVLNITKITTTLAQYEQKYTGAFKSLIEGTTMRALRKGTLPVIDLEKTTASPHLPRKDVALSTTIGKMALQRATLEGERRCCGNTGETLKRAAP